MEVNGFNIFCCLGERVIGEADSVLKFTPFSDGKQGISGKLYATNYRLSFITADRSSYDVVGVCTVKIIIVRTPQKIAVVILKFEQVGFSIN